MLERRPSTFTPPTQSWSEIEERSRTLDRAFYSMLVLLLLAPALTHSLKCWIGLQNWTEEPAIDNVRLAECPGKAECCAFVTSLNGNQFGCNETCPPSNYRQCGPDPRSGIQDLRYCYCRSHHDPKCTPFLESWDKRAKLTTPMPPETKRQLAKNRLGFMMPKPSRKSQGVKIIGPPAPPSIQPLPPGVLPPSVLPDPAARRPLNGRRPAARPPRPIARKLAPPPGKPLRRPMKKINPPK